VRLDVLCGGMPDRLVPRTVRFDPKPRIFGNCQVGASSVGASLYV
jgi:hypothetical protein